MSGRGHRTPDQVNLCKRLTDNLRKIRRGDDVQRTTIERLVRDYEKIKGGLGVVMDDKYNAIKQELLKRDRAEEMELDDSDDLAESDAARKRPRQDESLQRRVEAQVPVPSNTLDPNNPPQFHNQVHATAPDAAAALFECLSLPDTSEDGDVLRQLTAVIGQLVTKVTGVEKHYMELEKKVDDLGATREATLTLKEALSALGRFANTYISKKDQKHFKTYEICLFWAASHVLYLQGDFYGAPPGRWQRCLVAPAA